MKVKALDSYVIKKDDDDESKPGCSGIEDGGSPDSGASGESARLLDMKVSENSSKTRGTAGYFVVLSIKCQILIFCKA